MKYARVPLLALPAIVLATPAMAYIGPGAGLSLVGALWAVIAAVGAALFFIVAWPLRRMLRRRRQQQVETDPATAEVERVRSSRAVADDPNQPRRPRA